VQKPESWNRGLLVGNLGGICVETTVLWRVCMFLPVWKMLKGCLSTPPSPPAYFSRSPLTRKLACEKNWMRRHRGTETHKLSKIMLSLKLTAIEISVSKLSPSKHRSVGKLGGKRNSKKLPRRHDPSQGNPRKQTASSTWSC
jgi:hypothetical protein